jgi:hypothetical protein
MAGQHATGPPAPSSLLPMFGKFEPYLPNIGKMPSASGLRRKRRLILALPSG